MIDCETVIEVKDNEILNMYFGIIEDPRCEVNVIHPLVDILKLVMIAVLCGMDELVKIIDYGENKKDFLEKEFNIKLIPSKSTPTRVIAMISPKWLSLSVVCILNTLIKNKASQIMIDGKAIKSTDAIKAIESMMNIVTAYTDTGISLGQITVNSKSNEIPGTIVSNIWKCEIHIFIIFSIFYMFLTKKRTPFRGKENIFFFEY